MVDTEKHKLKYLTQIGKNLLIDAKYRPQQFKNEITKCP